MLTATDLRIADRLHVPALAFARGALVAVIGENGAGKSTLLDALAGLAKPLQGAIHIDTDDGPRTLAQLPAAARARLISSIGALEPDVEELFVAARIAQGLIPRAGIQWAADDVDPRVRAVSAELGCDALLHRRVGTLSTGERRRVTVARGLVDAQARVFVLDEPLSGVDVARQPLVLAALRRRAQAGAVVVFSVHELGSALHADRLLGLRAGTLVFDGPPAALDADALERVFGVRSLEVVRLGTQG